MFHLVFSEDALLIGATTYSLGPQLTHWHHNRQKIESSALEHENMFFKFVRWQPRVTIKLNMCD